MSAKEASVILANSVSKAVDSSVSAATAVGNSKTVVTLDQALAQIIEKTATGVEYGVDFLQSQIPDVIRQLLVFKMIENVVFALIALVVFVVSIKILLKSIKDGKQTYSEQVARGAYYPDFGEFNKLCIGICGSVSFVSVFPLVCKFINVLQIWLAPKVFLIEYASELVKCV